MPPVGHATAAPMPEVADVGARVRRIRQRLGLTVEEFARASALSAGIVSQLERGQGNPSYTTLCRLADGLGVHVADLLKQDGTGRSALVRAADRLQLPLAEDPEGLVRELLTPSLEVPMQVIRTVMPPRTSHERRPFRHLGTESVHVLSGRLVVVLGDERHELEQGDTITYDCTVGHWWENTSDELAELLGMTVPLGL